MSTLTAERLRELLDYDPETGIFTRLVKTSWRTTVGEKVGYPTDQGYIRMRVNVRTYKAHRLAWLHFYGEWPKGQLDHINRNRADNRIANLREAGLSENQYNRGANCNNSSGIKGVYWAKKRKKWLVQLNANKTQYYGGVFSTAEDAEAAATPLRAKLHGQFACDGNNVPE